MLEEIKKTIKEIFLEVANEADYYFMMNYKYYQEMIKIHEIFSVITCVSLLKDALVDFIKKDADVNKALSFLDNCFIEGSKTDFNKVDLFKYIRNAFNHSESKDLYSINTDGSINIDMPGLNLKMKLTSEELLKMASIISEYASRGIIMYIENQENINVDALSSSKESCIEELSKIKLVIIQNKNKSTKRKFEQVASFPKDKLWSEEPRFIDYVVDPTKESNCFEFKLYPEQCESIARLIDVFKKTGLPIDTFYCPIIYNYLDIGMYKIRPTYFDIIKTKEFLYNWDNSVLNMTANLTVQLFDFMTNEPEKNNIFKKYYYDFGQINNGVYYKSIFINILDTLDDSYKDAITYFTYVFSNIANDKNNPEEERIRNALVHKRYFYHENNGNSDICLYDNSDDVRKPVTFSTAPWQKKFSIFELLSMSDNIVQKYCQSKTNNNKK